MTNEEARTDITDLARRTQALFTPAGAAMPRVEQVMKVQKDMLDDAEIFTRHWMERRQEALKTGLDALKEMNSTGRADPAAAMRAISDWQRGSVERLTEDFREWTALCMQATQLATAAQDEAGQTEAGQDDAPASGTGRRKATNGPRGRAAASGAKADHATPV